MACSPDGQYFATLGYDSRIDLYDLENKRQKYVHEGHTAAAESAWEPVIRLPVAGPSGGVRPGCRTPSAEARDPPARQEDAPVALAGVGWEVALVHPQRPGGGPAGL
jgi:hypothetical protein